MWFYSVWGRVEAGFHCVINCQNQIKRTNERTNIANKSFKLNKYSDDIYSKKKKCSVQTYLQIKQIWEQRIQKKNPDHHQDPNVTQDAKNLQTSRETHQRQTYRKWSVKDRKCECGYTPWKLYLKWEETVLMGPGPLGSGSLQSCMMAFLHQSRRRRVKTKNKNRFVGGGATTNQTHRNEQRFKVWRYSQLLTNSGWPMTHSHASQLTN